VEHAEFPLDHERWLQHLAESSFHHERDVSSSAKAPSTCGMASEELFESGPTVRKAVAELFKTDSTAGKCTKKATEIRPTCGRASKKPFETGISDGRIIFELLKSALPRGRASKKQSPDRFPHGRAEKKLFEAGPTLGRARLWNTLDGHPRGRVAPARIRLG
jgi:hypothetical protein